MAAISCSVALLAEVVSFSHSCFHTAQPNGSFSVHLGAGESLDDGPLKEKKPKHAYLKGHEDDKARLPEGS